MKSKILLALLTILAISLPAQAVDAKTTKTSTPKVTILEPKNGATVPTTFTVKFGASGVDIVPAGTVQEHSGHYHLLIDTETLPDINTPIPTSPTMIHFGKGQTETELTLSPGKHTLELVLGNSAHISGPHPVVSKKITITVK